MSSWYSHDFCQMHKGDAVWKQSWFVWKGIVLPCITKLSPSKEFWFFQSDITVSKQRHKIFQTELHVSMYMNRLIKARHVLKTLRKRTYSNILKILSPKIENFQIKNSDIFHISAQNIDCGYSLEPPRRGGSNEYPQSMFLSRNKKNSVYPCKPQFYYIKVGFKGIKII